MAKDRTVDGLHLSRRGVVAGVAGFAAAALAAPHLLRAEALKELRIDFATYNPVSLLLREQGWLEEEFKADGTAITWVQSAGSNKALEFLSASAIDFGSTAGAAALVSKINGNPIKSIYSYSRPEWTALVTRLDAGIASPADLAGKTVALTRGTDPHIFLIRALAAVGLTEADITPVLLQHADGRTALIRGDVDAWAGLDPMMAAAELEDGATLFHRDLEANTFGILNVREEFLERQPETVARVLSVYERARKHALDHPDDLKAVAVKVTGLAPEVIDLQIDDRTDLTLPQIGQPQRDAISAAGLALQQAGVLDASVDVARAVNDLLEDRAPEA
ncbi:aliphatic sulfonate ABC transporter substrate-binding protein [Paracoccus caeni]|uniref:Putative aliphatic sulfonates-binding protein n=1 Tax=Paracoccus caeni TaxID=657651 RepID=A0A934SHD4_9RHOB|nr:aliphatic sulfonate ABC transporter substrate-binding protein [Paracoccus caeni]MBK4217479.1 aliphatic sulfonate ABC transporter substrate-binding protein [Paracoccus caeni]